MDKYLNLATINVIKIDSHYVVRETSGYRQYLPALTMIILFLAFTYNGFYIYTNNIRSIGDSIYMLFLALFCAFPAFYWTKEFLNTNDVVLVPEQGKILLRRQGSQAIVSEHKIEHIKVKIESVVWEDNFCHSYSFTLFDTNLNKVIFSIRPGVHPNDDATACGELEEFFNTVMNPEPEEFPCSSETELVEFCIINETEQNEQ